MVKVVYAGIGDASAAVRTFDDFKPYVMALRAMQRDCRPDGPDYLALDIPVLALETTATSSAWPPKRATEAMLFEMVHRMVTDEKPLRISCQDCPNKVVWRRAEAIRRCRPEATPSDLHEKLRCSQCGSRRVVFTV